MPTDPANLSSPFFLVSVTGTVTSGEYTFVEWWYDPTLSAYAAKDGGRFADPDYPAYSTSGESFSTGQLALARAADGTGGTGYELFALGGSGGSSLTGDNTWIQVSGTVIDHIGPSTANTTTNAVYTLEVDAKGHVVSAISAGSVVATTTVNGQPAQTVTLMQSVSSPPTTAPQIVQSVAQNGGNTSPPSPVLQFQMNPGGTSSPSGYSLTVDANSSAVATTVQESYSVGGATANVSYADSGGSVEVTYPSGMIVNLAAATVQLPASVAQYTEGTVTAAGTTQGTATALTAVMNLVSVPTNNAGVILQNIPGPQLVINTSGSNSLIVYPPVGSQITSNSTNAGITLAPGFGSSYSAAMFWRENATRFAQLSITG